MNLDIIYNKSMLTIDGSWFQQNFEKEKEVRTPPVGIIIIAISQAYSGTYPPTRVNTYRTRLWKNDR